MRRNWVIFSSACLILVLSLGAYLSAGTAKAERLRGVELATENPNLPYRQPIIGVNVDLTQYTAEELPTELEAMASLGVVWVRQPIYWADVEPTPDSFDWSGYDALIEAVSAHSQLNLVAVIVGTPPWARHALAPAHPFAPPASVQDFADFCAAFAERYQDQVDYYQIWDEPNLREAWGNLDPRPATYVAMLKQAYTTIHRIDRNATVIAAALAPTIETGPANLSDVLFLRAIYDLGGQDSFDAAAGKPYGFDTGPDDRRVREGVLNFSRLILLREVMVQHGDEHKPLWGSNFGWNSLPTEWTGPPSIWGQVGSETQIAWTQQAYARAAGEWPWLGGLILQHWQPNAPIDDPIQGFAIKPRLAEWQAHSLLLADDGLHAGMYPAIGEHINYSGHWQFGDSGADALSTVPEETAPFVNQITIPFYGTDFALHVRRDDYLAYLTVTIDGQPANQLPINKQGEAFLVLTSDTRQPSLDLIPVAQGLDNGRHIAVITHRPTLGDDRWSVAGFAVATRPDTTSQTRQQQGAIAVGILAALTLVYTSSQLRWGGLHPPTLAFWQDIGDLFLTFITSFTLLIGAVLSLDGLVAHFLRRDPPAFILSLATLSLLYFAPSAWLSLIGLGLFAVLVFNRPLLGVLAVIFWSIFFTATLDVHIRLITVIELMSVMVVLALMGRGLVALAREKRDNQRTLANLWQNLHQAKLTPLDVGLLAFGLLAVLSLTWADLLPEAFRELRTMILGPLALYVILRAGRFTLREYTWIVDMVIIGGVTIALTGLTNYLTGDYVVETAEGSRRLIGVYGSPNSVALHLGRCLPFALAYIPLTDGWRRLFGLGASLIMGIALLLTQSVGAILLGLPVTLAVMIIGWQGRRAVMPLLGLAGLGGVALIPLSRLIPRLRNISDFESSTTLFRVNLWRSTWEMLKDQPLTGVGLDQFLYAYRSRYILPEAWADPDLSHPHNWILDYWVRLGILGVILGIWLQVMFWRTAVLARLQVQGKDPLKFAFLLGAMGSMGSFLAHGLVDSAYFAINLSYLFVIALALVQWLVSTEHANDATNSLETS